MHASIALTAAGFANTMLGSDIIVNANTIDQSAIVCVRFRLLRSVLNIHVTSFLQGCTQKVQLNHLAFVA